MKNHNAPYGDQDRGGDDQRGPDDAAKKLDLKDSPHDAERLKTDETVIDLPDVKDIPGQEFVQVPPLGMLADTTISSADEEGKGLFEEEDEDDDFMMGTEADVSSEERDTLKRSEESMPTRDEGALLNASLDNSDFEGEAINEGSFGEERTGADLDLGDMKDDTTRDALGQGDEENKHFSLGGDKNDANEERS